MGHIDNPKVAKVGSYIDIPAAVVGPHASTHNEGGTDEVDATMLKNAYAATIALGG